MLIIPAIDLKDGACVRLRQGRMEDSTVFSDDPVSMAAKWVEGGCRRLPAVLRQNDRLASRQPPIPTEREQKRYTDRKSVV